MRRKLGRAKGLFIPLVCFLPFFLSLGVFENRDFLTKYWEWRFIVPAGILLLNRRGCPVHRF